MRKEEVKTKWLKRIGVAALAFCMFFGVDVYAATATSSVTKTNNAHAQDYSYNWFNTVNSYLFVNTDGGYSRVEYTGNKLVSENYDKNCNWLDGKTIDLELPLFGGVYRSGNAYYVMEGQKNLEESDTCTVFRLIQYDLNWNRVRSVDIQGANTYIPFDAGSCRFAEADGKLYIRTCHEMYASSDGYHHQASVTIKINMTTLAVEFCQYEVANSSGGYMSHSFNQYIKEKNGVVYAADHGDAYERGLALLRFHSLATSSPSAYTTCVNAFPFTGSVGNNYTGAMLGGFAVSDTNAIVVGSSMPQDGSVTSSKVKNIMVSSTSLSNFTSGGVTNKWITNYAQGGNTTASNPVLVEIEDNTYMLLWEVCNTSNIYYGKATGTVNYVFLDGTGAATSAVHSVNAVLSDCAPVVVGNEIVWYAGNDTVPIFYRLSTDVEKDGTEAITAVAVCNHERTELRNKKAATCTEAGYEGDTYCTLCGNCLKKGSVVPALGHSYSSEWTIDIAATATTNGSKSRHCTRCGEKTDVTVIPATGNGTSSNPGVIATEKPVTTGEIVADVNLAYTITATTEKKRTVVVTSNVDASAKKITIPATITINGEIYQVTAVGDNAYKNSKKLQKIVIGKNITSIGKNAFKGCKKLKTVTIKGTKVKKIGKNAFVGTAKGLTIKVPVKKKAAYTKLLKKSGYKKKIK